VSPDLSLSFKHWLGLWLLASLTACATHTPAPAPSKDPLHGFMVRKGLIGPAATRPNAAQNKSPTARGLASDVVLTALHLIDTPYQYGGQSTTTGFDCSAFTRYVYATSLGLTLARRAEEQASAASLKEVARSALQPGDLVFFNTMQRTFSHVGIYVGEGRFVHAPRTGARVRLESINIGYWEQRFTGARRLAQWD
jgi:cell wall-associated NlpC family hydrolase